MIFGRVSSSLALIDYIKVKAGQLVKELSENRWIRSKFRSAQQWMIR